jgi:hypothetical protein
MCTHAAPRAGKLLTRNPWGLKMTAGGMAMKVQSDEESDEEEPFRNDSFQEFQ